MGECFAIVAPAKQEWLDPFQMSSGCKFVEQLSARNPVHALWRLLATSGDREAGRWSGESVVVLGAYAEGGPFGPSPIYSACRSEKRFADLSPLFSLPVPPPPLKGTLVLNVDRGEFLSCDALLGAELSEDVVAASLFKVLAFHPPPGHKREPWGRWAFGRVVVTGPDSEAWARSAATGVHDLSHEVVRAVLEERA